jgi:hypothetical protein
MPAVDRDRLAVLADRLRARFLADGHPGTDFDGELETLTDDEWRALRALVAQRVAHGEELLDKPAGESD